MNIIIHIVNVIILIYNNIMLIKYILLFMGVCLKLFHVEK